MLKHADCLSTQDQERVPRVREERHTRVWILRQWAFAVVLVVATIYCYKRFWLAGEQVQNMAEQATTQGAGHNQLVAQTSQASWLGKLQGTISQTARGLKAIPKGTLIPVEIESARFGGSGQATVLARAQSYVFPDDTVMIPAGSEVRGIAMRRGDKWEIHWNSISVLSVGGRQADLQAMSEITGKAGLYGASLVVKAK